MCRSKDCNSPYKMAAEVVRATAATPVLGDGKDHAFLNAACLAKCTIGLGPRICTCAQELPLTHHAQCTSSDLPSVVGLRTPKRLAPTHCLTATPLLALTLPPHHDDIGSTDESGRIGSKAEAIDDACMSSQTTPAARRHIHHVREDAPEEYQVMVEELRYVQKMLVRMQRVQGEREEELKRARELLAAKEEEVKRLSTGAVVHPSRRASVESVEAVRMEYSAELSEREAVHAERLSAAVAAHEKALKRERESKNAELNALRAELEREHAESMKARDRAHADELCERERAFEDLVNAMVLRHERAVTQLKEEHRAALDQVRAEFANLPQDEGAPSDAEVQTVDERIAQLQAVIEMYKPKVEDYIVLKAKMEQEERERTAAEIEAASSAVAVTSQKNGKNATARLTQKLTKRASDQVRSLRRRFAHHGKSTVGSADDKSAAQ